MLCTHVGLYSYLPLSLEGPKGEGDKGGEGSPVGLGRCLPKCDTNPLTLPEQPCYSPHRSNTNLNISRRNQKPREAHPTHPRTQRPSPSQRPSRRPAAQANGAISFSHGSRAPSLVVRRWKDALDGVIADRPSPAETPSRWSVSSELTLYQAWGGGPAIPGRDSLSEVGPPASLRHIKQGADGPPGPSGGPRKYHI